MRFGELVEEDQVAELKTFYNLFNNPPSAYALLVRQGCTPPSGSHSSSRVKHPKRVTVHPTDHKLSIISALR